MRQGHYTGVLYDENTDFSTVTECCRCLSEAEANDEDTLNKRHLSDLLICAGCMGCPTAQSGILKI